MIRRDIAPRPHWRAQAEATGFLIHSLGPTRYWMDDVYYAFTHRQIERDIAAATGELMAMCLEIAARAARDDEILRSMRIPEAWWAAIGESWRRGDPALMARFDLAYDGTAPARMLECNGDTPGLAFETGFFQWAWLEQQIGAGALPEAADQFNRLHEALVAVFAGQWRDRPILHFAASSRNLEDLMTARYLHDCATQAGRRAALVDMGAIGVDAAGMLLDAEDCPIRALHKVYRWELLLREPFGRHLAGPLAPAMIEPAWKIVLSCKGLLPWLWRLFPGHPNLLPAWFADDAAAAPGPRHVLKPLFSQKGANVTIVNPDMPAGGVATTGPFEAAGGVVQSYGALPTYQALDGTIVHAQVGSWIAGGRVAGMCVLEDDGPIVQNISSRFAPHAILD